MLGIGQKTYSIVFQSYVTSIKLITEFGIVDTVNDEIASARTMFFSSIFGLALSNCFVCPKEGWYRGEGE
jgi:hypothetical protein